MSPEPLESQPCANNFWGTLLTVHQDQNRLGLNSPVNSRPPLALTQTIASRHSEGFSMCSE